MLSLPVVTSHYHIKISQHHYPINHIFRVEILSSGLQGFTGFTGFPGFQGFRPLLLRRLPCKGTISFLVAATDIFLTRINDLYKPVGSCSSPPSSAECRTKIKG
jgi:hypothetical protein